jgi:putative peptidoglycan lipid II flippase
VGNEGQQPAQPPFGPGNQPGQFGWQYEQEQPQPGAGGAAQQPLASNPPQQPQIFLHPSAQQPPPQYQQPQPPMLPQYQQPIPDMGSTLGYGQGLESVYYNAPQPSQSIPRLRQQRLQQLREDRMRRQQRRMKSDATSIIPQKLRERLSGNGTARAIPPVQPRPQSPQMPQSPYGGPAAPPNAIPGQYSPVPQPAPLVPPSTPAPPAQFSPAMPLPPVEISPSLARPAANVAPAHEEAQDTGMIQRVRIGKATMILTSAFIVSRVFGLLRTILFSIVFGAGLTSDAYYQAFLIPDTIFNIVAGGALSSAFIPVFQHYILGEDDEDSAWHLASASLNLAIVIMIVLAIIAIIFAGQIVPLYNPKTQLMSPAEYSTHIGLIVALVRIMLFQAIVLGAGVIVTSVLNAKQHFLLPAVGTVLYNVGIIAGLIPGLYLAVIGHRNNDVAVYGAALGVVLGAVLQVAIQIPGLVRLRMRYSLTFDWRFPGVIQIGRQMIPRIINATVLSFSTFVDRTLITLLGAVLSAGVVNGLITEYAQAFQLLLLPWSIFGATISTAAFPTLAENVTRNRFDRFRATIMETLRSILFMSIPSSVGLIALGLPIIQVLFEHGAFDLNEAILTAYPLAGFAIGLAGLSAVEILTRSFYALRDSKTPVVVSIIQFAFKIALSLILINFAVYGAGWGTAALAFSTSVATTAEAVVLLWLLQQRIGGFELRNLVKFTGRVLLTALIMGVVVFAVRYVLDSILVTTSAADNSLGFGRTILALIKLLIELFVGLIVYLRVARRIGIEELGPVRRVLNRFKLSWI